MLILNGNKLCEEGSVLIARRPLTMVNRRRKRNQRAAIRGRRGDLRLTRLFRAGLRYVDVIRPHHSTVSGHGKSLGTQRASRVPRAC
jgi:hypothetical protein